MSKGMVYTSFALMASALLISGAFVLSQDETRSTSNTRITEASFFLDGVLQDMDRSLSMASRRAFTSSTNYIIVNNQPLSSPEENVSSALVNGTISGENLSNMEEVSLEDWSERVAEIAEDSSYELSVEVEEARINASGLEARSYYSVFARLKDPVSLARFNRSEAAYTTTSLEGIEDPMITLQSKGRYSSKYSRCGFEDPVDNVLNADIHSEAYGYGNAVLSPGEISDDVDGSDKVLVVVDVDDYDVSQVNEFSAVISREPNSSSGYTNAYAFDTGSISEIGSNQTVLVDSGEVWVTRFERMFSEGCYVSDSDGPDVLDRMENRLSSDDSSGIATMMDVSELPPELSRQGSAVPHVYFSDSDYGGLERVKGVSDRYSWFYLDQEHVDYWGLEPIVK